MSESALLQLSVSSRSLSVSWVINSEVIPSNGPVFVLSAMMSPAANQHVALLEVVCACVSEGVGVHHWEKHTCSVIIWFCQQAWEQTCTSNHESTGFLWYTASQWCNILYMCYIGVLYCMLCGNYRSVMVMMYSNIFYIVYSMLQGDCSVLLKWVMLAVPVSPSFGETQLSRYVLIFWFSMNLWVFLLL